jgi:hypothetical protein
MVFQAFIDESYNDRGWFVLAGYVATAERWEAFSKEWEHLLPKFGVLDTRTGEYHFHMAEMMLNEERQSRIPAFGRVIEQHLDVMMSLRVFIPDIERAQQRLFIPDRELNHFPARSEVYRMGWNQILATFGNERQAFKDAIPPDAEIEFIFDKETSEKKLIAAWLADDRSYPVLSSIYSKIPSFESDRRFPPLQAADMLAWRVRDSCPKSGSIHEPMPRLRPLWDNAKPMKFIDMPLSEDGMVEMLMEGTADNMPSDTAIFDRKTGRRLQGRARQSDT